MTVPTDSLGRAHSWGRCYEADCVRLEQIKRELRNPMSAAVSLASLMVELSWWGVHPIAGGAGVFATDEGIQNLFWRSITWH